MPFELVDFLPAVRKLVLERFDLASERVNGEAEVLIHVISGVRDEMDVSQVCAELTRVVQVVDDVLGGVLPFTRTVIFFFPERRTFSGKVSSPICLRRENVSRWSVCPVSEVV